ncbi:MAG: hypothetical protein ABI759_25545 [Candidatus Solibacter sp.]
MGPPHAMEITHNFYNVPQPNLQSERGAAGRQCRRRLDGDFATAIGKGGAQHGRAAEHLRQNWQASG